MISFKSILNWEAINIGSRKPSKASTDSLPYASLAPINNADSDGAYSKALSWALFGSESNRISNIALTGPYGSGKSSIIKTFLSSSSAKNIKHLSISLATFKDNRKGHSEPDLDAKQKQIEISILQQIFYHEEQDNIPDSRLKRIRSLSRKRQTILWLLLSTVLLALGWISGEKWLISYLPIKLPINLSQILRASSLMLCVIALITITYKLIRSISGASLSKLKIHDAEFEIGKESNKSVLNAHIDEILYFFEVTDYDVVVIEDLDRFEQTEVFTKLREINTLINNAKSINRNVRFVYCVRDELFKDKDRTKFFDFIIPVIPVINLSNSKDILIQQIKKNGHEIRHQTIEDLSFFIDEMRLLHNIINEFSVYRLKLNEKLSSDKLFAMICYKNLYPYDFTQLPCNEGELYGYFAKKQGLISKRIGDLNAKIKELSEGVKFSESNRTLTLSDLRRSYAYNCLAYAVQHYSSQNTIGFIINGASVSHIELHSEKYFDSVANDNYVIRTGYGNNYPPPVRFRQIETEIDPNHSYSDKKSKIERASEIEINEAKKQISSLRGLREKYHSHSIKELLEENIEFFSSDSKQHKLIELLLREGYIEEDYLSYISIFHEGSLTRNDYEFILRVKTRVSDNSSLKLINVASVFDSLHIKDCRDVSVLNYDLIEFALRSKENDERTLAIFALLNLESEQGVNFVNSFILREKLVTQFVLKLAKSETPIWEYIETKSGYTDELKMSIFSIIAIHCDANTLKMLAKNSNLKSYYETVTGFDFRSLSPDKLESDILALNLKFHDISIFFESDELLDIIQKLNAYTISISNLEALYIRRNPEAISMFKNRNFEAICLENCVAIFQYISASINEYVQSVYLSIEENRQESQNYLLRLLNVPEMTNINKSRIIEHVDTVLSECDDIESLELLEMFAINAKLECSWKTILMCFIKCESNLNSWIIDFINLPKVSLKIASKKLVSLPEFEKEKSDLATKIVSSTLINSEAYNQLTSALGYIFHSIDKEIPEANLATLVRNKMLKLNKENIEYLANAYPSLFGTFIRTKLSELINPDCNIKLSSTEVLALLNQSDFSPKDLAQILNEEKHQDLASDSDIISKISSRIDEFLPFTLESFQIPILRELANNTELFLTAFNVWVNAVNISDFVVLLQSLPSPYSEIPNLSQRILIPANDGTRKFAQILKTLQQIGNYSESKYGVKLYPLKAGT